MCLACAVPCVLQSATVINSRLAIISCTKQTRFTYACISHVEATYDATVTIPGSQIARDATAVISAILCTLDADSMCKYG